MNEPSDVEVLLAGLEVGSLSELRRLVETARGGVVVTAAQATALARMHGGSSLRLRSAERNGYFLGGVHAEATDDDLRSFVLAPDVSEHGGCLGITYATLMGLPE